MAGALVIAMRWHPSVHFTHLNFLKRADGLIHRPRIFYEVPRVFFLKDAPL
jgi:hypothetical protein